LGTFNTVEEAASAIASARGTPLQSKLADKVALVDDIDYEWAMQWNWSADESPKSNTWYAVRREGHYSGGNPQRSIYMHVEIINRMGIPLGEHTDHRDRNGLNNQRGNLRPATCSQNIANQNPKAKAASGLRGAFFYKNDNRWYSHLYVGGKKVYLGRFPTAEAAHAAYVEAHRKYFGEFSPL
jgi:hypothetical protein